MTANQLWENVLVKFDTVTSLTAPGFDDARASDILTYVQVLYSNKILFAKTNAKREGFEETEIRKQGLSALIVDGLQAVDPPIVSSNQIGVLPNGVFYELPADFWIAILEQCTTNIADCRYPQTPTFTRIQIKAIPHDWINRGSYTYDIPYIDGGYEGLVWRLNHGKINNKKIHELITDGTFNVTNYNLRYLKIPRNIVVDLTTPANQVNPELDSFTHEALSDLAVKILKGIVDGSNSIDNLNLDNIQ